MRDGDSTSEHILLRQSATFTQDGLTRTIEIALPLRPDAPAEELARLLAQAEAGMAQLTLALDQRVAEARGEIPQATSPRAETTPATVAPPTSPPVPTPRPDATTRRAEEDEAAPTAASERTPAAPTPQRDAAPAGPDLTRPEFIAAVAELGMNPKEAMDRLGVRSLSGLNLREALETLRRQLLGGPQPGSASRAGAASTNVATSEPTAQHAPHDAMGQALTLQPARFDEEDDEGEVIIFEEDDTAFGDESAAELPLPRPIPGDGRHEPEEIDDLDDVPDFGPPSSAHARATGPAQDGAHAAPPTVERKTSRATQLIATLRAAHPGGIATADRQSAFRHIIVDELGEPTATALVRGLWKLTPDRLGPEQLDALIRWGKEDTFAEEAEQVLAALRAEQRARNEQSQTPAPKPSSSSATRRRGER